MRSERDIFLGLCVKGLKQRGLYESQEHRERLQRECREIDNQQEYEYFLDLVRNQARFEKNENNLLVAYVLGLVDDLDINSSHVYVQGEWPDIDCDYLPVVRDHLKKTWAPQQFGVERVCSIGNYLTYGPKLALTDMARVHGLDNKEIKAITTKMGLKDEDGDVLTIDAALELFPELKDYAQRHPEVIEAAKRLVGRNRGMGKHAGGLIVSAVPIHDMIPLVVDKEGNAVSAFTEGLHSQDLGPLGFIKFDLLVVDGLATIYECCKLIKQRHGVKAICALPGQPDWSDTSYLNDPEAVKMAHKGLLKCIFQFDSDGIRKMVKEGGVSSFDDLAAYSALYRPGPMQSGMHTVYIDRKNGKEHYELHPLLQPVLGNTYGVQVYQEQVMQILNRVGGVPPGHTEKARKAISKKDQKTFDKLHPQFLRNGQSVLEWFEAQVEELWQQVEKFSAYGFNKSHAVSYTYISARLLWLKAHYPLEFFTAKLRCEEDSDKLKEYKLEAKKMGIPMERLDLNKSGKTFDIVGDRIYIGFSNVKGIGDEVAEAIVAGQPYASFEDFLTRFGTDANVVKPLIGLGVFGTGTDRIVIHEFYEHFKRIVKRREERDKRAAKSRQDIVDQMRYVLPAGVCEDAEGVLLRMIDDEPRVCANYAKSIGVDVDVFYKLVKKYRTNVRSLESKRSADEPVLMSEFVPEGGIDASLRTVYEGPIQLAECEHYGFGWDHILELSPDYEGERTFDVFDDETIVTACVECQVVSKPERKDFKSGKGYYYFMHVEDANGRRHRMTVWAEDFERFKEEFSFWNDAIAGGNLLKIRIDRPDPKFNSCTFDSPPKHMRRRLIPEDKKLDHRLMVMAWPDNVKLPEPEKTGRGNEAIEV